MATIQGSLRRGGVESVRLGSSPIRQFQALGMRCSGTNYISALLANNTSLVPSAHLGWKHGFPNTHSIPTDLLVVVAVRNPIDWIRSLYRKPWHFREQDASVTFSQFIRSPVDTVMDPDLWTDELERNAWLLPRPLRELALLRQRWTPRLRQRLGMKPSPPLKEPPSTFENRALQYDRHPLTGQPFPHPVAMRAAKLTALLGFAQRECSCVFVQYEEARDRPEAVLENIGERFDVAIAPHFSPITEWLGNHGEDTGRVSPERIAADDSRFLAEHLDLSLERRLGYEDEVLALAMPGAMKRTREEDRNDVGSARHPVRGIR